MEGGREAEGGKEGVSSEGGEEERLNACLTVLLSMITRDFPLPLHVYWQLQGLMVE